jgi:molybdopterin-guanine dinucleotide biosynthesis protein A
MSAPHGPTGVVLAGGQSARLGRDKAALRLFGKTSENLLEHTAGLLAQVCRRVLISGRTVSGYDCVMDAVPGQGPMGGIAAVLQVSGGPCLALSCDLPFMNPGLLRRLTEAHATRPAGTTATLCRERETGSVQPLVALYEPACLPYFLRCLERGRGKMRLALPEEHLHYLFYAQSESRLFFNINSPDDLEKARTMIRDRAKA